MAELPGVSYEDDLTGLYNRRYLLRYLSTQVDWSGSGPVSFALIDLDAFHRVNEKYGHDEGDFVLQAFADRLTRAFRADDLVTRDGGDAFFAVLPGIPKDRAVAVVDGLLEDLRREPLRTRRDRFPTGLTASAGVVTFPDDGREAAGVRGAAESVLYTAKRAGGNRSAAGGRVDASVAAERDLFAGLPCRAFCGRATELASAGGLFEDVRGGKSALLLVQGHAGVGKSRFLRELAAGATVRGVLFLHAICNENQRLSIGHSLIYLVDQYYRLNPAEQEALRDSLFPGQRRVARELVAAFSQWKVEEVRIPPRDRTPLLLSMLEAAIVMMARRAPLLIILDNARHADRGTLDVLRRLLRARRAPLAVSLAVKGEIDHASPSRDDQPLLDLAREAKDGGSLQTLFLPPLTREDVAAMIRSILEGATLPAGFEDLLFQKSEGNPLYVEEAIRALLLRKRITREGSRYVVPFVRPEELPESLHALIEQVLAGLSQEAGELVTNAAILGTRFDVQELQEVMGKREGETLDAVDQVEDVKLIEHLRQDDYAFRSTSTRDVRYVKTPEEARKAIQRRASMVNRARGRTVAGRGPADSPDAPLPADAPAPAAPGADVVGRQPRIPEATAPLAPEAAKLALDFIRSLGALLRIGRLYPQWSQTSTNLTRQLEEATRALLAAARTVTFAADSRGVTVNGRPEAADAGAEALTEFYALLSDRLVASLTLGDGIEPREIAALVAALSAPMDRSRTPADHWDRWLDREGIRRIDILQRRYVARESETGSRVFRRRDFSERVLTPEELEELRVALRHFKAGCDNLRLYPPGHQLVEEALQESTVSLTLLIAKVRLLSLAPAPDGLLVNGVPCDAKTAGDAGVHLGRQLAKGGLNSITLALGLRPDEVQALVSIFAVPAEDPSWKQVIQTVMTGNEIRHFHFGARVYTALESKAGGVVPGAALPLMEPTPQPSAVPPPAGTAAAPAEEAPIEGSDDAGYVPEGMTVRADVRARVYLKADPARFLSEEFEREAGPLLDALSTGWTAALAQRLIARLSDLSRDPEPEWRQRALIILMRALGEAALPEARALIVASTKDAIGAVVDAELQPPALLQAAETFREWLGVALAVGRIEDAGALLARVRKRIAAKTVPPEFERRVNEKILELGRPRGAMAEALRSPTPAVREAALRAAPALGAPMIPALVQFCAENDNLAHRKLAASALREIGREGPAELAKAVSSAEEGDRVARVLSVLELAGIPSLVEPCAAALEHADIRVRSAAFALVRRSDKTVQLDVLQKLIAAPRAATAKAAISLAGDLRLVEAGAAVARLGQEALDEELLRACCEFFLHVKAPSGIPAMARVFRSRTKLFGLVKGFPDDLRALAVRAAAGMPSPEVAGLLDEAKRDRSPAVRAAAGAST